MIKNHKSPKLEFCIVIWTITLLIHNEAKANNYHSNEGITDAKNWEMSDIKNSPLIYNDIKNHTATIIFLHDYAENGTWWKPELESLRQPYMKVISPYANNMNISWMVGDELSSWFDFTGDKYPKMFEDKSEFKAAAAYVHHLIIDEIKHGINPERIIVSGFQQGALLALYSALTFPKRLGAIVALSPWHPINDTIMESFNPANKDIPIFQTTADRNQYTTEEKQLQIRDHLKEHISHNIEYKKYVGICMQTKIEQAFADAGKFCKKYVAPLK